MRIKITGERGRDIKEVTVEVIEKWKDQYTVRHTDGKLACISETGGCYHRMVGCQFVTLMNGCAVEVA